MPRPKVRLPAVKKTRKLSCLTIYSYFERQSIYQGMQPSKLDMWKGLGLDNDNSNSISLSRVWTDFWIQNSRFFPDFFQNNNFFFQTHSYQNRLAIETLKKEQEPSFINDAPPTYRWDWIWLDQKEKLSLVKHLL